jgi:hypothetical protein
MSLLLAACTLTATPTPFQTEVNLQTLVAGADIPTETISVPLASPSETLPPLPSDTPIPPTDTPMPIVSPTRPPDDPALRFGEPDWQDTFDTPDNWAPYDGGQTRVEIKDGHFFYTSKTPDNRTYWILAGLPIRNYYMEVTAQTPAVCSGQDRFGIIFRAPDTSQGYILMLSCEGKYRLSIINPSGIVDLVPWNAHPAIQIGPNQINRLAIWAEKDLLVVYINGVGLAGLRDSTYNIAGRFGFSIASQNTEEFTVIFDDLMIWSFP